MYNNSFLIENSDSLFKILQGKHLGLKLGRDSSHVRNIVRKGRLEGVSCYIKIGMRENLENAIAFTEKCPRMTNFSIPEILISGYFVYDTYELAYIIEKAIEGVSLHESETYGSFSRQILDIVFEIDNLPKLNLPRTKKHLDVMKSADSREKRRGELAEAHKIWLEGASLKFYQIYNESTELLQVLMENNRLELGTVHGEFNFHHILFGEQEDVWIIDWERASQAYPRFFDLAEYLGRLIVTVDGGVELASLVLTDFYERKVNCSMQTLLFGVYNRILGTLWEVDQRRGKPVINARDEMEIVAMLKSYFGD